MRRKRKLRSEINVDAIRPWFFWTLCQKCDDEIRREKMWRVYDGSTPGIHGCHTYYKRYCFKCCPTKEDAQKERDLIYKKNKTEKRKRMPVNKQKALIRIGGFPGKPVIMGFPVSSNYKEYFKTIPKLSQNKETK